jgi:hypothetical protein
VEAINCEKYIVNHTPTKDLKNIISEEAWTKIKPYVSHLHVFGSVAWTHIPDEKREHCSLKVTSDFFLDIMKMLKVMNLFNLIPGMILRMEICFKM